MSRELRADRLFGREVRALDNQRIGRLEEFRTEMRGRSCTVTAYVIGVAGLSERLGVGVRRIFGLRVGGYVARWDQIDLSDPDHPRLTCPVDELEKI